MRGLKDKGIDDIKALIARTKKLDGLDRIDAEDAKRLIDVLQEAEAIIVNMDERDEGGESVMQSWAG